MFGSLSPIQEKLSMARLVLRLLLVITVVLMLQGGLVGCNTLEGAGKDISAAGKVIRDSAEKAKPY
jgi:predicted small secreted protein